MPPQRWESSPTADPVGPGRTTVCPAVSSPGAMQRPRSPILRLKGGTAVNNRFLERVCHRSRACAGERWARCRSQSTITPSCSSPAALARHSPTGPSFPSAARDRSSLDVIPLGPGVACGFPQTCGSSAGAAAGHYLGCATLRSCVRRGKAHPPRGCEFRPTTVAPAVNVRPSAPADRTFTSSSDLCGHSRTMAPETSKPGESKLS